MKICTLVFIYCILKPSFAVEEKVLIRRAQHGGGAALGKQCHHACDCKGYNDPKEPVCCEGRGADKHEKCYKCCFHPPKACKHDHECCSQHCYKGKCVLYPRKLPYKGYCPILYDGDYLAIPPATPTEAGGILWKLPHYVEPKKTGPLKIVELCPNPKHTRAELEREPTEAEMKADGEQLSEVDNEALSKVNVAHNPIKPMAFYIIKGLCEHQGKKEWKIIQAGLLWKHWHGKCFKFPVLDKSSLFWTPHHTVDYTKYHVVIFWKWWKWCFLPWWLPSAKPLELGK